ncbi:MAG: hypothetical protein AB7S78_01390 [Candidatus Omnitrophota bacterium]
MPPPHFKKLSISSAMVLCVQLTLALFLCVPLCHAENTGAGQIIDLDDPEPASTRNQPRASDTGAPRATVQGAASRSRTPQPGFVSGLPPETADVFDPWRAHETMPQATAADFEEQSRINRAAEAAQRTSAPSAVPVETSSRVQKPSAADLDAMMKKIMDPSINALEKKRLAAVVFYHQDIYRKAAMLGEFKADSPQVKAFLEQKKILQEEIISRMGPKYKNQYGEVFKQPIVPFDYNNIYSDDDIVTGTGEPGRRAEKLYNESLNDVMREHVGRPMDALDRKRVDVNGLAWNMTEEAAYLDFSHHEKYINPQSGYANQAKLLEGAKAGKVTAFTFDEQGRMVKLTPAQTVEEIKRLAVDQRLAIPGIDATKGTGSMSDFLRMADMHQIRPSGRVTVEEVQQFLRNQKYSERVIGDYNDIFQADANLSKEHRQFIETSSELRKALTIQQTAEILEKAYGTKIIQRSGAIDYDALTAVMLKHQDKQLTTVLPGMIGEVAKTEGYKIVEWLKNAGAANRSRLRKEMALTYAPMDNNAVNKITAQIDTMPIDEADKTFLKSVVKDDSRQIRRYAELLQIPPGELTTRLKIDGDNVAAVDFISKSAKVKPLTDALSARKGGSTFQKFLESKTAKALNLDVMLSPDAKGEKYMQWCMLLVAASRAYSASGSNEEGLKAMGMATFEMVPFVASVLRFSEAEYKQAFVEFAMDLYPPVGLAHIATTLLNYGAHAAKDSFVESKWEQLAQSVLAEMSDDDFIESDIDGYWRLKDRAQLLEYLDEVSPGLGKIAKLSALIEPDIDARMSRDPEVQTNEQALYTILWFEGVKVNDSGLPSDYIAKLFVSDLNKLLTRYKMEELQARVYENGIPELGSAKPSERVAARIMLDNLRIRKKLYYNVLNDFMDRIERLYNEKKEKEEGGYGAIVGKAITALKEIYDNAPEKIRQSPWGKSKLDEDYRERLEYMTKYKPQPADKPDIEIQREMQQIIDEFREFIKKLAVVVDIYEEMQYLDLKAAAYGGDKSFEATDEILLGQPFRAGISARVSPKRKDLKWTVYYYALSHETGGIKLMGSVKLSPRKYSAGNEGYWVIEAPEKETFLAVDEKLIKEFFPDERWYFIRPVIAFGDWPSDPLSMVGADALKNPIEHPGLFSEERAAFVGERAEFGVVRGRIYAEAPKWIYRNDSPQLKITLRLPYYAQEGLHKAGVEAFAMLEDSPLPRLTPTEIEPVASDNYDPPEHVSPVDLDFPEGTKDTTFGITVKAELENVPEEYWPLAQTVMVNYVDQDNPETKPEDETGNEDGTSLNAIFAAMEALQAKTSALETQAGELGDNIQAVSKDADKQLNALKDQLADLSSRINGLSSTLSQQSADVTAIQSEDRFIYGLSEKLGRARGSIENSTLSTCEIYDRIKATDRVEEVSKLLGEARTHLAAVQQTYGDYQGTKGELSQAKGRVDRERQKANGAEGTIRDYEQQLVSARASLDAARAQVAAVENLTATLLGLQANMDSLISEGVGLVDKANQTDEKQLSKEDKKLKGKIEKILERMKKDQGKLIKTTGRSGSKKDTLSAALGLAESNLAQARTAFDGLKNNFTGPQQREQVEQALADFQATYDAGDLFSEPIEEANKNARICFDGIKSQYDQKFTPEARLAQADCSKWPGSKARWDPSINGPRCDCPAGQLWVAARNSCYDKMAHAVESINCSVYPNSEARWSEADQKALCYCIAGHEWNRDRNNCIVEKTTQVARTDCSMYGPSDAYWDTGRDQVLCGCRYGYEWNSTMTYCVEGRDSQVARTDCSMYGPSQPYWDNAQNRVLCGCKAGYEWNSGMTYCVQGRDSQVATADCSGYGYGAEAYWDYGRNQVNCRCRGGFQWNGNYTYCEELPRYDANDLANDLTTILNTVQGGSGAGTQGTNSSCTPGRNATEKAINQALGCPATSGGGSQSGSGGSGGNGCCKDGFPPTYGSVCLDGTTASYRCASGGSSGGSSGSSGGSGSGGSYNTCDCSDAKGPYEAWLGQCGDHPFKDLPDFRDCVSGH